MWHLLARNGLSERPSKQVTDYLIQSVVKTICPVEVNQLSQKGGVTPSYEAMSHAAVRIHERGSFGSTYDSALMMTNPTMIDRLAFLRAPGERESSQKNCRKSSPSSAGETDLPSNNPHANHISIC